jgi:hypothetical protein
VDLDIQHMAKISKTKLASFGTMIQAEVRKIKKAKPNISHIAAMKQAGAKLKARKAFK